MLYPVAGSLSKLLVRNPIQFISKCIVFGEKSMFKGFFLKIECQLSQAAACDGTRITTTSIGQEVMPGTLPLY